MERRRCSARTRKVCSTLSMSPRYSSWSPHRRSVRTFFPSLPSSRQAFPGRGFVLFLEPASDCGYRFGIDLRFHRLENGLAFPRKGPSASPARGWHAPPLPSRPIPLRSIIDPRSCFSTRSRSSNRDLAVQGGSARILSFSRNQKLAVQLAFQLSDVLGADAVVLGGEQLFPDACLHFGYHGIANNVRSLASIFARISCARVSGSLRARPGASSATSVSRNRFAEKLDSSRKIRSVSSSLTFCDSSLSERRVASSSYFAESD